MINVIISDSMVKGLKMKQFNSHFHGGKVYLKAFPGAKAHQLNHHVKPSLEEYEYDAAVIHVEINYILRSKGEKEQMTKWHHKKNYEYSRDLSKLYRTKNLHILNN